MRTCPAPGRNAAYFPGKTFAWVRDADDSGARMRGSFTGEHRSDIILKARTINTAAKRAAGNIQPLHSKGDRHDVDLSKYTWSHTRSRVHTQRGRGAGVRECTRRVHARRHTECAEAVFARRGDERREERIEEDPCHSVIGERTVPYRAVPRCIVSLASLHPFHDQDSCPRILYCAPVRDAAGDAVRDLAFETSPRHRVARSDFRGSAFPVVYPLLYGHCVVREDRQRINVSSFSICFVLSS